LPLQFWEDYNYAENLENQHNNFQKQLRIAFPLKPTTGSKVAFQSIPGTHKKTIAKINSVAYIN
jgi:hypothetical protein